ncbi:MAG: permease [Bacteroidetes bacterium HGW-Bacteroidetes-6]|jgi:lipopolysaccharide export system permease protein|nr:MAG: permease [Bacteroidetes bacterium HGW-Bacteroidetes-6]
MKKLHLLVLRAYIGPLILTFCIAIFVLLMQFLWKYIDDLVGKGLDLWIVVQLLFYASATFVPMALPLAILLASLMTLGNLGEHYELVAAKSSGISFRKIMMPLVLLSLIISGIAFYFSNQVLPVANLKMFSLLYDVKEQKPALNIKEGVFYRDIDGYVIKVGEKDSDGQTIRRVLVYDHTKPGGNNTITIAESGKMEVTEDKRTLIFTLYNGTNYNETRETRESLTRRPMQRVHFAEEQIRFDLSSFSMSRTSEDLFREHYQMMNLSQLFSSIDTLQEQKGIRQNLFARQIKASSSYFYHFFLLQERPSVVGENSKVNRFDEIRNDFSPTQYRAAVSEAIGMARSNSMMVDNYSLEIDAKSKTLIKHWVEIHRKFTLSIACLLLFFIGAPLGAIIRKGGLGMPLVISVIVFILYYIISITGEKFVKEGVLTPEIGMWISSAILLPFGVWLTIKTTADSPLMETEAWSKLGDKLKRFFHFKRKVK